MNGYNSQRPKVQANEVVYELHTLGWKAFQNLCVTITKEIWGQTVQNFFDSHDGGRDGAFHGTWNTKDGESFEGSFTAQCKFSAKADKQIQLSDLTDELIKAKRLASKGLSDNYFLFTNARLTGVTDEKIQEAFLQIDGINRFASYGIEALSLFIRESSRLRMLVPRVYGLGDLSQIFDERAHNQAEEILSSLGDDFGKFVITEAYERSARALIEHGFVLLLGEPACGKSAIAAALAVGALDAWGCSTFKIRSADEFVLHSNPNEPKQFFWCDDAFGATQFDGASADAWNRVFPHMHAAIRRGARILFTSRNYIYYSARQSLKESSLPIIRESQVVINVEQLRKEEREQILYNHIRLGSQPQEFKSRIKPFLSFVSAHKSFSPEIARRLGNPIFTKQLTVYQEGLEKFVAHPLDMLCEIIRTIDTESKSALALIFMQGGMLPSPINLTSDENHAVSLMGGTTSGVRAALNALKDSLVLLSKQKGAYSWRFKHPTIQDAFATVIAEDRELMDIYLAGAPPDRLLSEISCGDMGVKGVKVIVPSDRYELVVDRLSQVLKGHERALHRFLSDRCDHEFLEHYIHKHPEFISSLQIGSYLNACSETRVLGRLHEFNLLPDIDRRVIVTAIQELAIETPDAGFLHEKVRKLLTDEELSSLIHDIRTKLLPEISDTIDNWKSDFDGSSDESPEDHFDELVTTLKDFRDEFILYPDSVVQIESALAEIDVAIGDLCSDQSNYGNSDDYQGNSSYESIDSSRSIFEDVDL